MSTFRGEPHSAPWHGGGYVEPQDGGWQAVAPSPLAFADLPVPTELTREGIDGLVAAFADGFDIIGMSPGGGYVLERGSQ